MVQINVSTNTTTDEQALNVSIDQYCSSGSNFTNTSEIVAGPINWSTNCTFNTSAFGEGFNNLTIIAIGNLSNNTSENLSFIADYSPPDFINFSSTNVEENDIFYSPAEGYNLIHVKIGINDSYTNITNATVSFKFAANSTTFCSPIALNGTTGGNWSNSTGCNVTQTILDYNITNPIEAVAIINATDQAGHSNNFSINFLLHNLGAVQGPPGNLSTCFKEGTGTTNFSLIDNFAAVNLVQVIEINGSANCNPMNQSLPWGDTFKKVATFNFTSVNLSTKEQAEQAMSAIGELIQVQIGKPFSFQQSRIFVNSSSAPYLNTSASITLYDLPFSYTPTVTYDGGGNGSVNLSWSQGGFDNAFGFYTGNLTINVSGFSGYNISDNASPTITISSPQTSVDYSTNQLINVSANGTGTAISNLTITITNSSGSTLHNSVYIYNSTNSANCTNTTAGWDVINCILTNVSLPVLKNGSYNITVQAYDYGGTSGNANSSSLNFTNHNNSAPVLVVNLTWLSNSSGHKAFLIAGVSDNDGASDISTITPYLNNSNFTCSQYSNSSNGTFFNVTFVCQPNGSYSSDPFNVNLSFVDSFNASVNTSNVVITLPNFAPNISSVNITPSTAYNFTNLTCSVIVSDPDSDTLNNYTYIWYVNGSNVFNQTFTTNSNSTLTTGNYTFYDNITCSVLIKDEFNASNTSNATKTISFAASSVASLDSNNITNQSLDISFNTNNLSVAHLYIANNTTLSNISNEYPAGLIFISNANLSTGDLAFNNSKAQNFANLTILLGPAGLTFSPNITVSFNYSTLSSSVQSYIDSLLPSGDLIVKKCNNDGNNCISVPITGYDISLNIINVSIGSFSILGLYDNSQPPSQSSSSSGGGSGGGTFSNPRPSYTPPLQPQEQPPPSQPSQPKEQPQTSKTPVIEPPSMPPAQQSTPPLAEESTKKQEQQPISPTEESNLPYQTTPTQQSDNFVLIMAVILVLIAAVVGGTFWLFKPKRKGL
ncbi:MAG: hypothetical protein ACK4J0_03470 [Candidatus Anstonellaceae archaeon]